MQDSDSGEQELYIYNIAGSKNKIFDLKMKFVRCNQTFSDTVCQDEVGFDGIFLAGNANYVTSI